MGAWGKKVSEDITEEMNTSKLSPQKSVHNIEAELYGDNVNNLITSFDTQQS